MAMEWSVADRDLELIAADAERRVTAFAAYHEVHPEGPPPVIPRDAFRVYLLVEAGDAQAAAANIALARRVHSAVAELLASGSPIEPRERRKKAPRRPGPSWGYAEVLGYVYVRSTQLGFSFLQITERQRGRTSDRTRPLREARARIVAELIDDRGATAAQVAAVFGVSRQAVELLRNKGRRHRGGAA